MNQLKNLIISSISFIILISVSLSCVKKNAGNHCSATSECPLGLFCINGKCQTDSCAGVLCLNGSTCAGGHCNCAPGYSGTDCQTYDSCYGVTCQNGGNCINGHCNCAPGYEGINCASKITDKFTGNFNTAENCSGTLANYVTIVTALAVDSNKINLNPIKGLSINAAVSGNSINIITPQVVGAYSVSGSGTINSTHSEIDMTVSFYDINLGGTTVCSYVLIRQ